MWFSQNPYRIKFDWGHRGTSEAAERGEIVVIVDVLSFSTTAATAIHHGCVVHPCAPEDDAAAMAAEIGAELAVHRNAARERGGFSLSPLSFIGASAGTGVVLPSPNGAACSRLGGHAPWLLVGAIVNAHAAARAVRHLLETTSLDAAVIACGERWELPSTEGTLRVAVEDYLGAGALIALLDEELSGAQLRGEKLFGAQLSHGQYLSPEAEICAGAFLRSRDRLETLLVNCMSGRELYEKGFGGDVVHAAKLDLYDSVPVMRGERLERL